MNIELVDLLNHWPWWAVPLVLAVWGFAPRSVLRIVLLAFPRDDPRREEILAEYYVVPRKERPFWVVEQIEVALVEGIGGRIRWAATGRIVNRWHLGSGVEFHQAHPDTFDIPSDEDKRGIRPGSQVKLMFHMKGWGERMWVMVTKIDGAKIRGELVNEPYAIPRLSAGDTIKFNLDHVIDILEPDNELDHVA